MATLPLTRLGNGALVLLAKIEYQSHRHPESAQFIVDTGAARTIVLPPWRKKLAREFGKIKLGPEDNIDTLFGPVDFEQASGFRLVAGDMSGSEVVIDVPWVCFAKPGTVLAQSRLTYNLLGRNVLDGWTLYVDRPGLAHVGGSPKRKRPVAFLTNQGEAITRWLNAITPGKPPKPTAGKVPLLQDFFDPPSPAKLQWDGRWMGHTGEAPR